jgi:hypothetical protein
VRQPYVPMVPSHGGTPCSCPAQSLHCCCWGTVGAADSGHASLLLHLHECTAAGAGGATQVRSTNCPACCSSTRGTGWWGRVVCFHWLGTGGGGGWAGGEFQRRAGWLGAGAVCLRACHRCAQGWYRVVGVGGRAHPKVSQTGLEGWLQPCPLPSCIMQPAPQPPAAFAHPLCCCCAQVHLLHPALHVCTMQPVSPHAACSHPHSHKVHTITSLACMKHSHTCVACSAGAKSAR